MDPHRTAAAAAADASGIDSGLLGDYLEQLAAVATAGSRLHDDALERCRATGDKAAQDGIPLRQVVDLYLSATWRVWPDLPAVRTASDADTVRRLGTAVLRAADDAAAAVAEGYQQARRWMARREETARLAFVSDLLAGTGDAATLFARAEEFGVDLAAPYAVAVVTAAHPFRDSTPVLARLAETLAARTSGRGLVATRDGNAVLLLPAGVAADVEASVQAVLATLRRVRPPAPDQPWRLGLGRPGNGPAGVVRSFEEATDAIHLADRLRLPGPIARARDLLVYRVILRDRPALEDLVETVLRPLARSRGGAGPLVETVLAYAACGGNATATARALHLSVRALTYRLTRIAELSGHDPTRPEQLYVLHTAALGALLSGTDLDSDQVRPTKPSTRADSDAP